MMGRTLKFGALALLGGVSLAAITLPVFAQNIEATVGGTNFNGLTPFPTGVVNPNTANQTGNSNGAFNIDEGNVISRIVDPVLADLRVQRSRLTYNIGVDVNFTAFPNRGGTAVVSTATVADTDLVRARITASQQSVRTDDVTNSTVRVDDRDLTVDAAGISGTVQHLVRGTINGDGNHGGVSTFADRSSMRAFFPDFAALNLQRQEDGRVRAIVRRTGGNGGDNNIEQDPIGIRVTDNASGSLLDVSSNSVTALSRANVLDTGVTIDPSLGGSNASIAVGATQYSENQEIVASNRRFNVGVSTPRDDGSDQIASSDIIVTNNNLRSTAQANDAAISINGDLDNSALDFVSVVWEQNVRRSNGDVDITALMERSAIGLALNRLGADSDTLVDSNVSVRGNTATAFAGANRALVEVAPADGLSVPSVYNGDQRVEVFPAGPLNIHARQGDIGDNNFAGTRFGVRVENDVISRSTIDVSDNSASAEVVVNEQTLILGVAAAVQAVLDFEGSDPADLDLLLNAAAITGPVSSEIAVFAIQTVSGAFGSVDVNLLAHSVGFSATVFDFNSLSDSTINIGGNTLTTGIVVNDTVFALAPLNGAVGSILLAIDQSVFTTEAVSEARRSLFGLFNGASIGGFGGEDVTLTVHDNLVVSQFTGSRRVVDIMGLNSPLATAGLFEIFFDQILGGGDVTASVGRPDTDQIGARFGVSDGVGAGFAGGIATRGGNFNLVVRGNGVFANLIANDETVRLRRVVADFNGAFYTTEYSQEIFLTTGLASISNVGLGIVDVTGIVGSASDSGVSEVNVAVVNNTIQARLVGNRTLFALEELSGDVSATGVFDINPDSDVTLSTLRSMVGDVVAGIQTSNDVAAEGAVVSLQITDLSIAAETVGTQQNVALGDLAGSNFAGRFLYANDPTFETQLQNATLESFVGLGSDGTTPRPVRVGLLDADDILGGDVSLALSGINVSSSTTGAVFDGTIDTLGPIAATGEINLHAAARETNAANAYLARTANVTVGVDAPAGRLRGPSLVLNNIRVGADASAVEASQNVTASSGTIAGQLVLRATQEATAGSAVQAQLGADGQPVIVGAVLQTTSGAGLDTIISGVSLSANARGGTVSQIVSGISGAVTGSVALSANQSRTGGSISATATNATIGVNTTLGNGTSIIRGSGISAGATGNQAMGYIGN